MRTASKFPFTAEQKAAIDAHRDELQKLCLQHDPTFKGNCKPVNEAKIRWAQALMSQSLFADLPGNTRPEWQNVSPSPLRIVTVTNHNLGHCNASFELRQ